MRLSDGSTLLCSVLFATGAPFGEGFHTASAGSIGVGIVAGGRSVLPSARRRPGGRLGSLAAIRWFGVGLLGIGSATVYLCCNALSGEHLNYPYLVREFTS